MKKLTLISGAILTTTILLSGCSSHTNTEKQAKEAMLNIQPKIAKEYTDFVSKTRPPKNYNCLDDVRLKEMIGMPGGETQAEYNKIQKACVPYYQKLSEFLNKKGISGVTKNILIDLNVQAKVHEQSENYQFSQMGQANITQK